MTERERAHADLVAARARIADPTRWTQGASARDRNGKQTAPDGPEACQWCAAGSLWFQCGSGHPPRYEAALRLLLDAVGVIDPEARSAAEVNDTHDHKTTLRLFDEAIREAAHPTPEATA